MIFIKLPTITVYGLLLSCPNLYDDKCVVYGIPVTIIQNYFIKTSKRVYKQIQELHSI